MKTQVEVMVEMKMGGVVVTFLELLLIIVEVEVKVCCWRW